MKKDKNTSYYLDKILEVVTQKDFLENKKLANEIGFYIFDYSPIDELLVRQQINHIAKRIEKKDSTIKPAVIDLYEIMLTSMKNEGLLKELLDVEKKEGTNALIEQLEPLLAINIKDPNNIISLVKKLAQNSKLVFIIGVGNVWPLLRAHVILNNLQTIFTETPVIMCFPGEYDTTKLKLFGKIKSNNYYRAFRLKDIIL